MMPLDDFAVLTGAIQSLVLSIAVVIGGGWALYQFISLNSIAKSKADLESIRRSLSKRSIIQLNIEHEIFPHPTIDAGKCLLCTVHLKNIGSHGELIDGSKTSLVATPISVGMDDCITELPDSKLVAFFYFDQEYPLVSIDPGESLDLQFVTLLPKAGMYILSFESNGSAVSQDQVSELESIFPHLNAAGRIMGVEKMIYVQ
jgi:hypothetical protein